MSCWNYYNWTELWLNVRYNAACIHFLDVTLLIVPSIFFLAYLARYLVINACISLTLTMPLPSVSISVNRSFISFMKLADTFSPLSSEISPSLTVTSVQVNPSYGLEHLFNHVTKSSSVTTSSFVSTYFFVIIWSAMLSSFVSKSSS